MAGAVTAAKRKATQARAAEPALLQRLDVVSNEKSSSTVSLINGTVRVLYWESILADTVSASVIFTDAGNTMSTQKTGQGHGKRKKKVSAVEGLPILGGESVYLKFTDNQGNTLDFNDKNGSLILNDRPTIPTDSQTTSKSYELILSSPEYINNEKERVRYCSAETLSEQVKNILKNVLKSEKIKDENFEDTKNSINYIGKNRKPFYVINDLSKKSVSAGSQELGFSAGYLFWETSEGYHFKSIDTILTGEQKKKIIYNESADNKIPKGYDIKALTLETSNRVNVQKKYQMGAYCTRSVEINGYDTNFKSTITNAFDPKVQEKLNLSGGYFAPENDAFTKDGSDSQFSRTTYYFADVGQQHMGESEEQIEKSKEENFKKSEVVNQSIMRYNQLFASQITITIPGDFSLHAGDCVWMDIPEISESENKACGDDVNKVDGGLYTIADLCHYITAKQTYTKLNLIRDSFGRVKGQSSTNDQASKVMDANFLPYIK